MTKRTPATEAEQIDAPTLDGLTIGDNIAPFSHIAAVALDEWFVAHVHGTALSRNTRAYNEAHAAYQRLRGFLSHLDD
jgi:hypothetical protein